MPPRTAQSVEIHQLTNRAVYARKLGITAHGDNFGGWLPKVIVHGMYPTVFLIPFNRQHSVDMVQIHFGLIHRTLMHIDNEYHKPLYLTLDEAKLSWKMQLQFQRCLVPADSIVIKQQRGFTKFFEVEPSGKFMLAGIYEGNQRIAIESPPFFSMALLFDNDFCPYLVEEGSYLEWLSKEKSGEIENLLARSATKLKRVK